MRKLAFSFAEILTVVVIVALLVGIALPIFAGARRKAKEVPCEANLHQLGAAVELYQQSNDGVLPESVMEVASESKVNLYCPQDVFGGANRTVTSALGEPVSYFFLPSSQEFRSDLAAADSNFAVAYCTLHGRPLSDSGISDPILDTTGEVLRVRIDGSVTHAQVRHLCRSGSGGFISGRPQWILLSDAKCPPRWCLDLNETCF